MKLRLATFLAAFVQAGVLLAQPGPDHELWNALVREYVSPQALVDYAGWIQSGKPRLEQYVGIVGRKWPEDLAPEARKAALINAYNALTVSWILANYPVKSIWQTKRPFTQARHLVDGRHVSLDGIETSLREMGDPRIHAVLVCASRGCPPLRREAYIESRLDGQLDDATRTWLANPGQNEFLRNQNTARISKIFKWYGGDFEKNGGSVWSFLARYSDTGPSFPDHRTTIRYKSYHWGLNDASGLGRSYSQINFLWDAARNK